MKLISLVFVSLFLQPAFAQLNSSVPTPAGDVAVASHDEVEDLVRDVSNFFGKGTELVGGVVRQILADLGQPNATIKGSEGGGAFIVGYKKGNGILNFNGQKSRVYWSGASLGFDIGGDGSKVYMLVYRLKNRTDLYRTFGGAEGRLYFVAGGGVQLGGVKYESEDTDLIIVPIRLGVGWRQGVNVGTLKLSAQDKWFPF